MNRQQLQSVKHVYYSAIRLFTLLYAEPSRKCLQIMDLHKLFSYDMHTFAIRKIINMFREWLLKEIITQNQINK
jgi:hypothetical protein